MSHETKHGLAENLFVLFLTLFVGIGVAIMAGLYDRSLSLPSGVVASVLAFFIFRRLIGKQTPK